MENPLNSLPPTNEFGVIPNVGMDTVMQNNRVQPRQIATGVLRGTQRIQNVDGSYITLGVIPDTNGEFGIGFFDASGNIIKKVTATTDFYYDPTHETTMMEIGKMPDGTYNVAIAQEGNEVEDAFN